MTTYDIIMKAADCLREAKECELDPHHINDKEYYRGYEDAMETILESIIGSEKTLQIMDIANEFVLAEKDF